VHFHAVDVSRDVDETQSGDGDHYRAEDDQPQPDDVAEALTGQCYAATDQLPQEQVEALDQKAERNQRFAVLPMPETCASWLPFAMAGPPLQITSDYTIIRNIGTESSIQSRL
jgi:hypothetical protein